MFNGLVTCIRIFLALASGIILVTSSLKHCLFSRQQGMERAPNNPGLWHSPWFSPGIGYNVRWVLLQLWYMRELVHYVYRDQRRSEGLCPSANMEQVSSTGRSVQITVTEGYDLVKCFTETVPSLFILLESTFAFELRSPCQTSTCELVGDVLGAAVEGMKFCITLYHQTCWLYIAMALPSQCYCYSSLLVCHPMCVRHMAFEY